jgi:hypothetical protein
MTGRGIRKMTRSVVRLNDAMMYQIVKKSRHLPGRLGIQNLATGMHTKVSRKERVTAHAPRKRTPQSVAICIVRPEKMRRYWRRMEILTRHMPTL